MHSARLHISILCNIILKLTVIIELPNMVITLNIHFYVFGFLLFAATDDDIFGVTFITVT